MAELIWGVLKNRNDAIKYMNSKKIPHANENKEDAEQPTKYRSTGNY